MKAPVATNRWNFALAIKNTSSGPSSVASLNSGCGWVLSMSENLYLDSRDRLCKFSGGKRREIVDPFADADKMHGQLELLRQRHQDSTPRGAVELGHHEARDAC